MIMRLTILIASISLAACASHTNVDIDELAEARAAIAAAKDAGAEQCAPALQAKAVAYLYWTAHEINEHGYHPEETAELKAKTLSLANEARKQSGVNCAPPAPVVVEIIKLDGINFEHNSADLTAASTATLDKAVATLNRRSEINVEVAAHTDSSGSDAYNQALSDRRAASVMDYLAGHGISTNRLSSKGYGESQPIVGNDTAEGRAKNRRVELRVMK
ncbi:OmpA family protein [Mariprofundus ferrinatatus]|uniref:OmpA family protein n=1 Tax=Mariprofundus ferrinatatus TaxID=1921087 RepID=A0A2K8L1Y7_9PROT|nr:OmpA family protein [Mariprofundus ferrinatatus]ATX81340.1 OmpA family protein [Mariprofundus ferrinatatus]